MAETSIASKEPDPLLRDKTMTTAWVTYVLLFTFVLSIAALFVITLVNYADGQKPQGADLYKGWFELLKNGLVLTGTALTTIIGYYFGQRESKVAYEKAFVAEEAVKTEQARTQTAAEAIDKLQQVVDEMLTSEPATGSSDDVFDPSIAQDPLNKRKHDL